MGESSAIKCLLLNHEILCPIHNRARRVYATIFFWKYVLSTTVFTHSGVMVLCS